MIIYSHLIRIVLGLNLSIWMGVNDLKIRIHKLTAQISGIPISGPRTSRSETLLRVGLGLGVRPASMVGCCGNVVLLLRLLWDATVFCPPDGVAIFAFLL
jgi:hypothetical protein